MSSVGHHDNNQYLLILIHQVEYQYILPLVTLEVFSEVPSQTPSLSVFSLTTVNNFDRVLFFSSPTYIYDNLDYFVNV